MTSDPITARLRQEIDMSPDDDYTADAHTYCHVFLDHIQSKRKPVWGSGNDRQEWSIEMEQNHIVISRGIEDRKVMAVMAIWWCHRGET